MAYKIGNYEFRTQKEYDEARKELNLVKQIRDKYNISDPKIASQLLTTIERGDKIKFKTSIGKAFIEILRKNAKVQTTNNSQVTKNVRTVPEKREQTVSTRYTGTKNGWQTEELNRSRRSGGGWQTDNQCREEKERRTWENDEDETGRNTYRPSEPKEVEKKKIKVKKKNWKKYHTKRNAFLYLAMIIIGGMLSSVYMGITDLGSADMMSDPINAAFFTFYGIGMGGFIVTLWFGILRLIYKQASTKRLWGITGTILAMVCIIAISLTGVGAVSLMIVPKAIRYFWPTDDDLGVMEVEIEVPVASKPKAKKMFEQFEITGFKEIPYEEYQKFLNADKEEREDII